MPRDDGITMQWFVKVEGRVYGPYTGIQMRVFVGEGRIAPHSYVCEQRDGEFRQASQVSQIANWLEDSRRDPVNRTSPAQETRTSNFIVVVELKADNRAGFETVLLEYGNVESVTDTVWIVRGATNAAFLRNELSHLLDRSDKLLVVDASRDRAAWFNLGQNADQQIRNLWGRRD